MEIEELNGFTKYDKFSSPFKKDNKWINTTELSQKLPIGRWVKSEKIDGCLHYNNTVYTDVGFLPIGRIVNERLHVKILSYNIDKQITEYKDIEHYHKEEKQRDFLSVCVKSKRKGNKPKHIVCTDNHKFFSNNNWIEAKNLKKGMCVSHLIETINEETKQLILGTLLGDSSIYRPSKNTRGFSMIHSIVQSDYFEYKKKLLNKLFNEHKGSVGGFLGSKRNRRGSSIINNNISQLILDYCERDNKKYITYKWANELSPLGLAFWYMDDGSISKTNKQRPRARFATNGFSYKEVLLLKNMFKSKYNIESKIFDYKGFTLCLTAESTEKLFSIIFPYICDSMKYKLSEKYKKYNTILNIPFETSLNIVNTEVISVSKKLPAKAKLQQKYQYDLSIKDNYNYFTCQILVHNTNIRLILTKFNEEGNRDIHVGSRKLILNPGDKGSRQYLDCIKDVNLNKIKEYFKEVDSTIIIYGEGYGAGVQKGGIYSKEKNFRVFDIRIGNAYQDFKYVEKVCIDNQLNLVPILGEVREITYGECITSLEKFQNTLLTDGDGGKPEGIVYKFEPVLLNKYGERLIFKVKYKDFIW